VTVPIIFAVGGAALLLFFFWLAWGVRQDFETLVRMPCPACSRPFGKEAAMAARRLFQEEIAEWRQKNPSTRLRIVGRWPIQCPACGFKGHYHVQDRRLLSDGQ